MKYHDKLLIQNVKRYRPCLQLHSSACCKGTEIYTYQETMGIKPINAINCSEPLIAVGMHIALVAHSRVLTVGDGKEREEDMESLSEQEGRTGP